MRRNLPHWAIPCLSRREFHLGHIIFLLAQLTPTSTFSDVLLQLVGWLAGPGFSIAVSQALESWKWFKDQPQQLKFVVSAVLTALGTIGGYLLGSSPAIAAIPQNNPTLAMSVVLISYAITQLYHALTKPPDVAITTTTTVPTEANKSTTTTTSTTVNPPDVSKG